MFKELFLKYIYPHLSNNIKEKVLYLWKKLRFLHRHIFAEFLFFISAIFKIKIYNLNLFEQHFYCENGEDGILRAIFNKIKPVNFFAVEFGISSREGNSVYLKKKGWKCLWMDANGDGEIVKREWITAENINELFEKYNVPYEFDLLSIDVDFNDYWIWKAIDKRYRPKVVVIEYNSSIPQTESKVVKYDPNGRWDGKTNYFGASLLALTKLAKTKGYVLVCCDSKGVNAFFVREDLVKDNFLIKDIKEIYKPPKYGKKIRGKYIGYQQSDESMIEV